MTPEERKRGLRAAVQAQAETFYRTAKSEFSSPEYMQSFRDNLAWQIIDSLVDEAEQSGAILREFMADVLAAGGPRKVGEDWPDLIVTYNKARMLLRPDLPDPEYACGADYCDDPACSTHGRTGTR